MARFFDRLVTRVARRDSARAQNKRSISTGSVESESSIEKLSLRLAQPISRRRALGWLGAAGTAATAAMTGLWPQAAWATPTANHGVCASLNAPGVTSGLYGLCVSYCEALDCPNVTEGPKKLMAACKSPDRGILANYNRLRKPTDPEMPCVKPKCPCWKQAELDAVGVSYSPHVVDFFWDAFSGYSSVALVENRFPAENGAFQVAQAERNPDGSNICRYFNADFTPGAPAPIIRVQTISAAEVGICEAQVKEQAQDVGAVCSGTGCPP